ncbi:DUF1715-domain-containing protein [Xylariaceae sp. FL0662B]|nr:DUF1715-domain-containing protein [Xylariaceae sp. FL0662B]
MMTSDIDIFDDLLHLEDQYHQEGYDQGYQDGAEAGRIEGRSVGLKAGFDKFLEAGRLQSKAVVWANRIPNFRKPAHESQGSSSSPPPPQAKSGHPDEEEGSDTHSSKLPPLHSNARLEKNIMMLYGLVEPGTLSTQNTDEAVNDFDSRMKGAQGKLKLIERAVGEGAAGKESAGGGRQQSAQTKNENIEDIGRISRKPAATESNG